MTGALRQQAGLMFETQGSEFRLETALQPIVGLIHQRVVGYEALVRGFCTSDDRAITPDELFSRAAAANDLMRLDAACQQVHLASFSQRASNRDWLFLNVRPESVLEPGFPDLLIERAAERGVSTRQVVIELLETPLDSSLQSSQLERAIAALRAKGFVIALDDFGAGHSNLDRVLDLKPDLIKLDRRMIVKATLDRAIRRVLPTMISLLHEIGTLVVAEGIETALEASIALDAGTDFGQGYFFGMPAAHTTTMDHVLPKLEIMRAESTSERARRERLRDARLGPHQEALRRAAQLFARGEPESEIAAVMLSNADSLRCFNVDEDGIQFGHVFTRGAHTARFLPLDDENGANWETRPYFREAIAAPGRLVSTFPYLSISGNYMCVTIAITVERDGRQYVLGIDIQWD